MPNDQRVTPIRHGPDCCCVGCEQDRYRGTGTNGPAPRPAARPRPAAGGVRVAYGTALRHIIRTVEAILKAENVQLGDGPRQDLYSTIYIDFARKYGASYDFTREPGE